jgi:hypothetical protein
MKIKVATSASYFNNPAVVELLRAQDFIITTNVDLLPVRLDTHAKLVYVAGGHMYEESTFAPLIRAQLKYHRRASDSPSDEEIDNCEFEVTTFGDIVKLNEDTGGDDAEAASDEQYTLAKGYHAATTAYAEFFMYRRSHVDSTQ